MIDLDALEALHAKATAGPWVASMAEDGEMPCVDHESDAAVIAVAVIAVADMRGRGNLEPIINADCIAGLHNAFPALAAELRGLRAKVEGLRSLARAMRAADLAEDAALQAYRADERAESAFVAAGDAVADATVALATAAAALFPEET